MGLWNSKIYAESKIQWIICLVVKMPATDLYTNVISDDFKSLDIGGNNFEKAF